MECKDQLINPKCRKDLTQCNSKAFSGDAINPETKKIKKRTFTKQNLRFFSLLALARARMKKTRAKGAPGSLFSTSPETCSLSDGEDGRD
ncbi:hypothetical protein EUGRSUZ_B00118 [Eucalyptus grandis]|uniref:Uncharacterized protein n=2 Tax=Eucalyptus grandis TaxID=71139 RepID=A0ACC3LLM6_EUCGR|nr:hypothetical protein EUGRSUZ_B00118 [Eucalyptus grandis]